VAFTEPPLHAYGIEHFSSNHTEKEVMNTTVVITEEMLNVSLVSLFEPTDKFS
jgi:hypothetical protein